jgi:16S rRNA (cytosine967-C5)-methyltransferase
MLPWRPMRAEVVSAVLDALDRQAGGAWSDRLLQAQLARRTDWSSEDRGFFVASLRGVLESGRRLDWILAPSLRRPPRARVHQALRLGLRLLEEGRAAHAVLSELLKALADAAPGERALVNAVLRGWLREPRRPEEARFTDPRERLRVLFSLPEWFLELLTRLEGGLPEEGELGRRLAQWRGERRLWVRVNASRWSPAAALDGLQTAGLEPQPDAGDPGFIALGRPPAEGLASFAPLSDGRLRVQDLSTRGAVALLEAQEGERVLDLCAAPGGKTLALLDAMPGLRLTAIDADEGRCRALRRRIGDGAEVRCADGRHLEAEGFDRVLLDAPCTGSGSAAHRPEILHREQDPLSPGLARLQEELLEAAWRALAPGGRLVYSTCSLDPRENGGRLATFLQRHPEARLRADRVPQARRDASGGWLWLPWSTAQEARPRGTPGAGGAWAAALDKEGGASA